MNRLLNVVRTQAARALAAQTNTRPGLITSYDPNTYSVKVALQPDGTETGWLPLGSLWVGNGWGMFSPPEQGDMVEVHFAEGSGEAGIASLRLFSDVDRPLPVPSRELWLVHKSGASFKMTNDGKVTFSDGHGATVSLNGDGTITSQATMWHHTGPMAVVGDVSIDGNTMITGNELVGGAITGTGGMAISGGAGGSAASIAGNLQINGGDVTADTTSLKGHHHNYGSNPTSAAIP